jgi:hypothetical protein
VTMLEKARHNRLAALATLRKSRKRTARLAA